MFRFLLREDLVECRIEKRINRFVVLVSINRRVYRAYITNTGRLKDLVRRGVTGYCLTSKGAKTSYNLIGVDVGLREEAALIDTRLQEKVFYLAASEGHINWLDPYRIVKRYPLINAHRLDFYIAHNGKSGYIELKSAVLLFNRKYGGYPDCPSPRGRDHIRMLIKLRERGHRSILLFVVAHPIAKAFKPYREGDPIIWNLILEARKKSVELRAIKMLLNPGKSEILIENENLGLSIN